MSTLIVCLCIYLAVGVIIFSGYVVEPEARKMWLKSGKLMAALVVLLYALCWPLLMLAD